MYFFYLSYIICLSSNAFFFQVTIKYIKKQMCIALDTGESKSKEIWLV